MMKLNVLVHTAALTDDASGTFGIGTVRQLRALAGEMARAGIAGDLYELPGGSRAPSMASPFSLTNGFALNSDDLDLEAIAELAAPPVRQLHDELLAHYRASAGARARINYALVHTVAPALLRACHAQFVQGASRERRAALAAFEDLAGSWLPEYALFELYKEQGVDLAQHGYAEPASPLARALAGRHEGRLAYFRYVQFLCFEQRMDLLAQLRALDIGLVVNVPFGVETHSADVYFHPEVFDDDLQVGCSPEPENGYPEQLWGLAAYRERTPALRRYLASKMRWLANFGTGVFFDHMVGWCGQYVAGRCVAADPDRVAGRFLDTDPARRRANLNWFIDIVLEAGLGIRGEVVGDPARLAVTVEVMQARALAGSDVSVLRVPWKRDSKGELAPLRGYGASDLVAWGTHDMETPLQLLCDRKGDLSTGYGTRSLLACCRNVLGLPFFDCDVPLAPGVLGDDLAAEIARRMVQGVPANNVLLTWPGLVSLLAGPFRDCSVRYNINITPGTPGDVDNLPGNWSYCAPPVTALATEPALCRFANAHGRRVHVPFAPVRALAVLATPGGAVDALGAALAGKARIVHDAVLGWRVGAAVLDAGYEVAVLNRTAVPQRVRIDLRPMLDSDAPGAVPTDADASLDGAFLQLDLPAYARRQLLLRVPDPVFINAPPGPTNDS